LCILSKTCRTELAEEEEEEEEDDEEEDENRGEVLVYTIHKRYPPSDFLLFLQMPLQMK
jgi:hypothetical protein